MDTDQLRTILWLRWRLSRNQWSRAGGLAVVLTLIVIGIALALSDAVHHFLVLWPIVGSPQFDLVYPR